MDIVEFNNNLKLICPKFFDLHQDYSLTSTSFEMTLGALATYFVYLLESEESNQVEQLLIFIEDCMSSTDFTLKEAVLNHFLLAIYELESLEIIENKTLFDVLKPSSKASLQKHLDIDSTTLLSKIGPFSSSTKVL